MNTHREHSISARLTVVFIALVLLASFLSACTTVKEKRYEKDRVTLIYKNKSVLGSDMENVKLEHPIRLSEDDIRNQLLSLRYEELSLLGKGKYVYSPDDILEITRLLTKAVHRLRPENIVHFEWETPRGSTVVKIFSGEHQLHWRFDKINGVEFASSSFPGRGGASWRLVPKEGQAYHASKSLLGRDNRENWIVADLNLPPSTRKTKEARSSRSPAERQPESVPDQGKTNSLELEEKLETLKTWREKNLIDEQDYQRKRKELLNTFL